MFIFVNIFMIQACDTLVKYYLLLLTVYVYSFFHGRANKYLDKVISKQPSADLLSHTRILITYTLRVIAVILLTICR